MRYFVWLSYKGTRYHGWQRQDNALTVQQVLEEAFSVVFRQPIAITGAGRTDTGVHASCMAAHFDTPYPIAAPDALVRRLNSFLPPDIALSKIVPAKDDAHARFDALSRRYEYRCTTEKDAFMTDLLTRIPKGMDFDLMNIAARQLLLTDDFASFCRLHSDVKTTLCKVTRAEWTQQNGIWVFTIEANRFLRNMVRAIVGTLWEVGKGKMSVDEFTHVIQLRKRVAAGQSAPAEGLFLVDIQYPESLFCPQD